MAFASTLKNLPKHQFEKSGEAFSFFYQWCLRSKIFVPAVPAGNPSNGCAHRPSPEPPSLPPANRPWSLARRQSSPATWRASAGRFAAYLINENKRVIDRIKKYKYEGGTKIANAARQTQKLSFCCVEIKPSTPIWRHSSIPMLKQVKKMFVPRRNSPCTLSSDIYVEHQSSPLLCSRQTAWERGLRRLPSFPSWIPPPRASDRLAARGPSHCCSSSCSRGCAVEITIRWIGWRWYLLLTISKHSSAARRAENT